MKAIYLRPAREKKGLTQEQLEALSGVSQGVISRIESGRIMNPTIDTVTKLEQALKLKTDERLAFGQPNEAIAS